MKKQSTLTLSPIPQESLRALEKAVAQRFNWRIMAGGADDQPRFLIEKQVRYDLIRGWPIYARYQIMGGLQLTESGKTTLQYVVSGQVGVPLFHAALHIAVLLVMVLILGTIVFSPGIGPNWIGILMLGVLLLSIIVYGWFAYRSYQGHLRELDRFMEEFAQRMGGI